MDTNLLKLDGYKSLQSQRKGRRKWVGEISSKTWRVWPSHSLRAFRLGPANFGLRAHAHFNLSVINIGSPKWNHQMLSCGVRCASICVKINPYQSKANQARTVHTPTKQRIGKIKKPNQSPKRCSVKKNIYRMNQIHESR